LRDDGDQGRLRASELPPNVSITFIASHGPGGDQTADAGGFVGWKPSKSLTLKSSIPLAPSD